MLKKLKKILPLILLLLILCFFGYRNSAYYAFKLMENGDIEKSELLCEKILKNDKENIEAWQILASIKFQKKDYQRTKEILDKVIEKNPFEHSNYLLRGMTYFHLGELDYAEKDLMDSINEKDKGYQPYLYLGLIELEKGNTERSKGYIDKAIDINDEALNVLKQLRKENDMNDEELTNDKLLEHVQLAINPVFRNWILFRNGTYIIMEDIIDMEEIKKKGIEMMKEFGPVHVGSPAADFGTITLNKTKGWVVSGYGYGMYTYVHPMELEKENPSDVEIGLYGRNKRDKDGMDFTPIYISSEGLIKKL